MFLNNKEQKIKEIRKDLKRLNYLLKQLNNTEYIQLDEPEFYGWRKFYTLNDEVKNDISGDTYRLYKRLYDLVNNEIISKSKDFLHRVYNSETKYEERKLKPKSFTEKDFEKIDDDLKQYFQLELVITKHYGFFENKRYLWVLKDPWFLVEKVEKYYITEKKIVKSQLQSEYDKLYDKIFNENSDLLKKAFPNRKNGWDTVDAEREKNRERRESFDLILNEVYDLELDVSAAKIDI